MKEIKFQRNAFIILLITFFVMIIVLIIDAIVNGLTWMYIPAILYVGICTIERYNKYKAIKRQYKYKTNYSKFKPN